MTTYNTGNPLGSSAPKDLYDNAQALDEAVNSTGDIWTDRFGVNRPTLASAIDPTGLVRQAVSARDDALLAKDAAISAAGPVYISESEGRAAVGDGEVFRVFGGGDIAISVYRKIDTSTSELLTSVPSSQTVQKNTDALSVERYGAGYSDVLPVPSGTANASGIILLDWPQVAGRISKMHINSVAAGTVDIYVYERSADTFTLLRQASVNVASTGHQVIPLSIPISDGEYIAVRGLSGSLRYSAGRADGNGWRAGSAGASFTQATVNTTTRMMVRFDVSEFTGSDSATPGLLTGLNRVIEQTLTSEKTEVINNLAPYQAPTNSLSPTATFLLKTPASDSGGLVFECRATSEGVVKLLLMRKISETRYEQRTVENVTVAIGENSIPLSMKAEKGDYFAIKGAAIGYRSETSAGTASFFTQNFVDPAAWAYNINILAGFRVRSAVAPHAIATGRPFATNLPWEYMFLPALGHSLIEGSQTPTSGTAPITIAQEFDNLSLPAYPAAPTQLLPATVANSQRVTYTNRGEWPGLGAAAGMRKALQRENNLSYTDIKSTIVVGNNGVGGAKIADIAKGTAQYNSVIAQAAALAGVSGGTAGVPAVLLGIGENDTDIAAYLPALLQLVKDLDADLRTATGQVKSVPTVMYQMSTQQRGISLSQLSAAKNSDLIALACPGYMLGYYDNIHIDSVSERILGAYFAEAVKTIALDGGKFEPLWPVSCDISGNFVTITFNKSGLVIDSALVPAQTNNGFAVSGVVVNTASVINGNQVRLVCESEPPIGAVVSYGVNATGKAPFIGRAGNLRDNSGRNKEFDGFPLHNWCVEFDWVL